MFYSEAILSRRGPLGKVWLAAHMERKLSKTQTLQTDIGQSVDAIVGQDIEFMALRLSGQLLLGVVRIYSRKAKYLLDDCNEALLKIKMAFRPGVVDMAEDQLVVKENAITLPGNAVVDLDILLPDINWDQDFDDGAGAFPSHQANIHDITLPNVGDFTLNDPFALNTDGIGSQDFDFDIDLGIDFGDGPSNGFDNLSVDGSVGVGRDAAMPLDDLDIFGGQGLDTLSQKSKSRAGSEHPFGMDMNIDAPDFGGMDLGDLGIGFDDIPPIRTPGQTRSPSRASSPLTDLPLTPPPGEEPTPKPVKTKRKPKEKKQIIDSVTELQGGPGQPGRARGGGFGPAVKKDLSDILVEPQFLPRSDIVMRLLEVRNDPLSHFFPTKITPQGTFFCGAPPGLPQPLSDLFMFPVQGQSKRRGKSPQRSPNKRRRLEETDDVEEARRAGSMAPSIAMGSDVMRARSVGFDGGHDLFDNTMEDFPHDEFDGLMDTTVKSPGAQSRYSTPAADGHLFDDLEESYADASCPIAAFDTRPQTQTQESVREPENVDGEGKGYSRNTVKALGIIRHQLRPRDGNDAEEKVLSFRQMADKASRRAAAGFFFELLVLGTRDCIKITQGAPFENIEVRAKDKLWERQQHHEGHASRANSVAP